MTGLKKIMLVCVMLVALLPGISAAQEPEQIVSEPALDTLLPELTGQSYKKKEQVIKQLVDLGDEKILPIMQAMLNGTLYFKKDNKEIVYTEQKEGALLIQSVLTGEMIGEVKKNKLKKVKTNNKLRGILRAELAKLNLKHKETNIRLKAANELIEDVDGNIAELFKAAMKKETSGEVKEILETGLAMHRLNSEDESARLEAIKELSGSLYPQVKNRLRKIIDYSDAETNPAILKAANSSLSKIESRIEVNRFIENAFFGLSLGSVLLLAAIGLAITFGVMGVINMAHGELIMLGAYTTYIIQSLFPDLIDYSLIISIPAAFIVSGLFGIAIERGIIRHLYGRPLETLLATFGVSLILQQLVRTTISAQNVIVSTPGWMSGSLQINPVLSVTYNRLYIIIFSLVVFAALLYVLKKTVLGLQVRAVSQNRAMAKAMGVRSDWVDALTFGLGSGIAGIAGVALSQLTNVGPNLGQSYIIDSFMVVVFGGVGNLWGTLVGAMSLGVVNKFLEPWSGAVLAKILVLIFIILFIQKRPRGLFPQKGRAAEN